MSGVVEEVACAEFERFLEGFHIDPDFEYMSDEKRAEYDSNRRVVVRGIMKGQVTIDESGRPTVRLLVPPSDSLTSVTYHMPVGEMLTELGGGDRPMRDQLVFHQSLTKTAPGTFFKIALPDMRICNAILHFFMSFLAP